MEIEADALKNEVQKQVVEGSVTNYRLHLVYTVFYLFPILVIEFMHVPITIQPTLCITALHISHIKYISL